MSKTTISWTNKVWNPLAGCSRVSSGCTRCYAERMANRLQAMGVNGYEGVIKNGKWTGQINLIPEKLNEPLRWKKPSMIFVNSMSDLFHEKVSFDFIKKIFDIMLTDLIPRKGKTFENCEMEEADFRSVTKHTYQILTKRPERAVQFFDWAKTNLFDDLPFNHCLQENGILPSNIWLGVSAEDIHTFDERRFFLSQVPVAVKFISLEPLLGNINFDFSEVSKPDWVIVGGESGTHARPMKPDWVRNIRDQCKEYQIPLFFKQWGEFITGEQMPPEILDLYDDTPFVVDQKGFYRCGKKKAGNLLDGIKYEEYPEGLK